MAYKFTGTEKSEKYLPAVNAAEKKYGLPKNLLANLLQTESSFNPKAVGPRTKYGKAKGIAQIIPKFHPGVDPFDPEETIEYTAKTLKEYYDRFGDWDSAIASWNAGPTNVGKHGLDSILEMKEFKETQNYLKKINSAKEEEEEETSPTGAEPIKFFDDINVETGQPQMSRFGDAAVDEPQTVGRFGDAAVTDAPTEQPTQEQPEEMPAGHKFLEDYVRPIAQGVGAGGGAVLGSGVAPLAGTVAGGALGFAIGDEVVDLVEDWMGYREPKPLALELKESAEDIGEGLTYELAGHNIAAVAKPLIKPAKWIAGKFTKKGAEKQAGQIIAAMTDKGPIIAKNWDEAKALEAAMPGLRFDLGQTTGEPGIIRFAQEGVESSGDILARQAEQRAANTQAIQDFIQNSKAAGAGTRELKAPLTARQSLLEEAEILAKKNMDDQIAARKGLLDPAAAGKVQRGALYEAEAAAREEAAALFDAVPNQTVEVDDIYSEFQKIMKPRHADEQADKFPKLIRSALETMRKGPVAKEAIGDAPVHGTSLDNLEGILNKGLEKGSAVDFTKDKTWAREFEVQLEIPGVQKGEYVAHNNYHKSANAVKPSKVIVDLDAYTDEGAEAALKQIDSIKEKFPNVDIQVRGTKPTSDSVTTKNIAKMYEKEFGLSAKEALETAQLDKKIDSIKMWREAGGEPIRSMDDYKTMVDWYAGDINAKPPKLKPPKPSAPKSISGDAADIAISGKFNDVQLRAKYDIGLKKVERLKAEGKLEEAGMLAQENQKWREAAEILEGTHKGPGMEKYKAATAKPSKTSGTAEPAGKPVKSLTDLQGLRSELLEDLRTARDKGYPASYRARLNAAVDAIDNKLSQGAEGQQMQDAAKFFRENVVERFHKGATKGIMRGDETVEDALVSGKFFKPGPKGQAAAQDFNRALGDNEAAKQALKDTIDQSFLNKAVSDKTGEINKGAYQNWLKNHKLALKEYGLENEYDSFDKARKILDRAQSEKASFDKSVATQVLGADVGDVVSKAFSKGSKKEAAQELMSLLDSMYKKPHPKTPAAYRSPDGKIFKGRFHMDAEDEITKAGFDMEDVVKTGSEWEAGFINESGDFLTRSQAKTAYGIDESVDLATQMEGQLGDETKSLVKDVIEGAGETVSWSNRLSPSSKSQALAGLQNAVIDEVLRKVPLEGQKVGDLLRSKQMASQLRKYDAAIREIFKDSPQKIKAMEAVRRATARLEMVTPLPRGEGAKAKGTIETMARNYGHSRKTAVSIAADMFNWLTRKVGVKDVNNIINKAILDPELAMHLKNAARGGKPEKLLPPLINRAISTGLIVQPYGKEEE